MNRRQLLKATLTGAVAAIVAPVALVLAKKDRGVAAISASPQSTRNAVVQGANADLFIEGSGSIAKKYNMHPYQEALMSREWFKDNTGRWFHFTQTIDRSQRRQFIDGQEIKVIDVKPPRGWGDYAELERRVLTTLNGKADIQKACCAKITK